jgi:hypothetical protein
MNCTSSIDFVRQKCARWKARSSKAVPDGNAVPHTHHLLAFPHLRPHPGQIFAYAFVDIFNGGVYTRSMQWATAERAEEQGHDVRLQILQWKITRSLKLNATTTQQPMHQSKWTVGFMVAAFFLLPSTSIGQSERAVLIGGSCAGLFGVSMCSDDNDDDDLQCGILRLRTFGVDLSQIQLTYDLLMLESLKVQLYVICCVKHVART